MAANLGDKGNEKGTTYTCFHYSREGVRSIMAQPDSNSHDGPGILLFLR